jgi:hypothetical protein
MFDWRAQASRIARSSQLLLLTKVYHSMAIGFTVSSSGTLSVGGYIFQITQSLGWLGVIGGIDETHG